MDDLINVLSKIFKLGKVAHAKVHHALHQQAIGGGVDFGEVAKLLIHKKGAKPVMSDPRIIEMLGSLADGVGELFNLNPDMVHTFHKHLIGGWKMPTMAQATAVAKFGKEMYDLGKPMYDAYNKKGGRRAPTAHSLAVKRVMQEHGMKLGQASKYVKEHGLAHM